jgi:hypothetical protein
MRSLTALLLLAGFVAASAQSPLHPRDAQIHDADTLAWWHTTEYLASDAMEGRDTGSAAYQRAADYVANRFRQAGLKPAGDTPGSFFQTVAMHQVIVTPEGTSLRFVRDGGGVLPLKFLEEFTVTASRALPRELEGKLTFRGYCGKEAMADIAGKVVVCFGTQRRELPSAAERSANARAGNAIAIVSVDDPGFTIEPRRWPEAYARAVGLGTAPAEGRQDSLVSLRLGDAAFTRLLEGTGHDAAAILANGSKQAPLASFDLPAKLEARFTTAESTLSSPNILGVLPGSDPVLKAEYVLIAAHLDGYGFGTPVKGDALYNGALDDAAYVALLIQFADDLKREHKTLKRSILFCAFTGEEKGLLGSNYFIAHPTIPISAMAADINLDQLRPLFPLHLLTALAIDDTSLGATAREVGKSMQIELRPDSEPERGLLRRADHFPFLRAGVPAIGFIFGYDPGTDAEARYREWYQVRYHRPQDDLTQPMDFDAAAKFDQFFYKLTETVADAPTRPIIYPQSTFSRK